MYFEFEEDVENFESFVVHQATVHAPGGTESEFYVGSVGGEDDVAENEVGYIKAAYIPSKTWRETYTGDWGLLRWGSDFKGWCEFRNRMGDDEFYDFPRIVKALAKRIMRCREDWLSDDDVEEMSQSELEERFEFYMEKAHERFDEERERTRKFHVDKPQVDFICVAKDRQRRGYGTALYRKMTEELDRRFGFSLHASTLQRDAAEKAWEKLITLDWNEAEEVPTPFVDDKTRYKISAKTKQVA